jgi:hypothetical protein
MTLSETQFETHACLLWCIVCFIFGGFITAWIFFEFKLRALRKAEEEEKNRKYK